jgi:hypothetical protein
MHRIIWFGPRLNRGDHFLFVWHFHVKKCLEIIMKDDVQAAVAAVALAHENHRKISSVFAYSGGGYRSIDVSISGNRVSGYDYQARCHIDGNIPSLYHYGERSHIDFKPKGNGKFDGYDYGSRSHFEVTVRGSSADVYDYGGTGYSSYSL